MTRSVMHIELTPLLHFFTMLTTINEIIPWRQRSLFFYCNSITTIIFGVNVNVWKIWPTWILKNLPISLLIIFKTIYFLYCKLPKLFQGHYNDYNTKSSRRKRKMIFLFLKGVNSLFYGAIRKCNVLCRNLKCHGLIWSKNILSVSTS